MTVCMTYPCRRGAGGCPICDPPQQLPPYFPAPQPTFTPVGCICPPTSEKTCENPVCPRKGIRISGAATVASFNVRIPDADCPECLGRGEIAIPGSSFRGAPVMTQCKCCTSTLTSHKDGT